MKIGFLSVIGLERVTEYRRELKDGRCDDCIMGMLVFEVEEEMNLMNN